MVLSVPILLSDRLDSPLSQLQRTRVTKGMETTSNHFCAPVFSIKKKKATNASQTPELQLHFIPLEKIIPNSLSLSVRFEKSYQSQELKEAPRRRNQFILAFLILFEIRSEFQMK